MMGVLKSVCNYFLALVLSVVVMCVMLLMSIISPTTIINITHYGAKVMQYKLEGRFDNLTKQEEPNDAA